MTTPNPTSSKKKKPSSVRHTRAIQRDRSKRPTVAPSAPQVEARLTELLHPATFAQVATFHALGLRDRILNLPVMVAFVLSLIWRQLGSVSEAVRVLNHEGLLWVSPLDVSQQAVSERLRKFPAALFEHVLLDLLPRMQQRWLIRKRPLSPALHWAQDHFETVLALDGSTLDAVLRKAGLVRDGDGPVLAGRMAALLDIVTHLPQQIWYEPDQHAHDQRFWERVLAVLTPGSLLLFDLGFLNYPRFDQLTDLSVGFITPTTQNIATKVERVLETTAERHDRLVWVGSGPESRCEHLMRLVEVRYQGKWYRYLTNVVDPQRLPAVYVAALYWQRWRIEDAFNIVKRLLGLAYFWVGSVNGVMVQVWATWLLYAVLVDLTDAVAEALRKQFGEVSMEMVYRGLYHYTQAFHRGDADDVVSYLATKAKQLGILKRNRKDRQPPTALLLTSLPGP
jgi:DNA-binding transcriptional ArsR family regulator